MAACASGDDAAGTAAVDASPTEGAPAEPTAAPTEATTEPVTEAAQLEWAQVSLGFVSAYVLVRGNRAAVVDTGTGGSAPAIGDTLATLGVTYDDVEHVILTHNHQDHVGGLNEVLAMAPAAMAYVGEADAAGISSSNPLTAVGDGDEVFGLQVINTPGHTPGSISVLDTGIGLLVAGDALTGDGSGSAVQGPNPDFTPDMDTATASIAKLAGFEIDTMLPGHGSPVATGAGASLTALVDN